MAHDSYKTAPECELTCPCRTASRETPDADRIYQMDGAVRASSLTEGVPGSLDLVAEFDRLAAESRARRAGGVGSATADTGTVPGSGASGDAPPVSPSPEKKLRVPSKKELKRRKAEREGRAMTPSWLLEEDPMVQAILETPHEDT